MKNKGTWSFDEKVALLKNWKPWHTHDSFRPVDARQHACKSGCILNESGMSQFLNECVRRGILARDLIKTAAGNTVRFRAVHTSLASRPWRRRSNEELGIDWPCYSPEWAV